MAGLTPTGFDILTFEEIRAEINSSCQAAFGPSIDVSDSSVLGQFIAIVAEREAILWELAQAVNGSLDPDAATGTNLDALCALTGTQRENATNSTATLTLTGTNGTTVATGSQASVEGTDEIFETLADATLATLTSWSGSVVYALGAKRTNASRCYVCTVAGTSAGSGGPTTTGSAIVDNTVTWRYLGEGAASITVAAQASNTGPIVGVAYSINQIETPVSGWSSVTNELDATPGTDIETDESLRIRREAELAFAGTSTTDAIRVDLLEVADVEAVTVFVNNTDTTDGDGIPPHAIEALVQGGADQDIWDMLLASVAAGIATYGAEVGTSTDDAGNNHTMRFSRPDTVNIYVAVELTKDPETYPLGGDDDIKAAIIAFGDAQATGKNVTASSLIAQCFKVAGVLDVTVLNIDDAPTPITSTTIPISLRQLAVFDTSRITVTSIDGVP
jgi:uncharacterized phage protein gp47/JayE